VRSIHVVAALIWRQGRVLLDRRPPGGRHAGLWEFPGGKRERGETDQQALARELWEELGVESRIGPEVARTEHTSDGASITLVLYRAEITGEPTAREVEAIEWYELDALETLPMPPADRPLIRAVRQLFSKEEAPPQPDPRPVR
jgi:8-oxo-dGTP diphosphatase